MVQSRMSRFVGALPPRDDASIAYRGVTAATVLVSVLAAVLQAAVTPAMGAAAILLVPLGSVFSYRRRHGRNVLVKIVLAFGLLFVFAAFLQAVRGAMSVDATRSPLVAMFLWVQVLHSFDVPRARDLTFSVAASVALIALAGSLAFSTGFIIVLGIHAVLLVVSLVLGHAAQLRNVDGELSEEIERPTPVRSRARRALLRGTAAFGAATLLSTTVAFVLLPRLPGAQVAALPFTLTQGTAIPRFVGNVALPNVRGRGGGSSKAFDPKTYFGYGRSMDLRVRGRLSDELVMRVRSPVPSLYRGQVYDTYHDGTWTSSDKTFFELRGDGVDSITVPTPRDDRGASDGQLIQTFYVERALPNIVFHAYRPREVYIASTTLRADGASSLRIPFLLERDTIYSVVSNLPPSSPDVLRTSSRPDLSRPSLKPYLQLPATLSSRFSSLATRITGPQPTTADKAIAVERWLHRNKRYRLDIPRDPSGKDPVDVFVFDRKEGFCEQIAATMALMLRASGVPTRLVAGFGQGERNPFTGYWEVKNSDAHAWVEVYYADYGWVPYDPTFGVPIASAANNMFMFAPLKRLAARLLPAGLTTALSRAVRAIPGPGRLVVGAVFVLLIGAAVSLMRKRRRSASGGPRAPAVDAWLEVEKALRTRGLRREPHETAIEFAHRVAPSIDAVHLDEVAERFSSVRYGDVDDRAVDDWVLQAQSAASAVRRA